MRSKKQYLTQNNEMEIKIDSVQFPGYCSIERNSLNISYLKNSQKNRKKKIIILSLLVKVL